MPKRKRIGLVGFFGWGNFGDELFVETYKQWLGADFDLVILNDLTQKPYFSRPLPEVLDGIDAIVIGGGDLIIPWSFSELYWKKEYLRLPVFIVGVGVPTWKASSPFVIARLKDFVSHPNVRMIETRDRESAEWIAKNLVPAVEVTNSADLVFALKLPKPEPAETSILGVVTRARSGKVEELTQVVKLCEKAKQLGYKLRHIILGTLETGVNDLAQSVDLDMPDKELIYCDNLFDLCRSIGECNVLASMKFHGTVVAVAYGIPSLVLSATNKSRNLMGFLERTELISSLTDPCLADRFSPYMARIPSHSQKILSKRAAISLQKLKNALHG